MLRRICSVILLALSLVILVYGVLFLLGVVGPSLELPSGNGTGTDTDPSSGMIDMLGVAVAAAAVLLGAVIFIFLLALAGAIISGLNMLVANNKIIHGISKGLFVFYSVIIVIVILAVTVLLAGIG